MRDGVTRTLERLNLGNFVGQGVPALLAALARILAPSGATAEEAIAAAAYHETMAELIDTLDLEGKGIDGFAQMDEALVRATLQSHVVNVVTARLLQVLATELEHGAVTAERAVAVEGEVRDYIESAVSLQFGSTNVSELDWDSPQATRLIERLFRQGYEVFGGGR